LGVVVGADSSRLLVFFRVFWEKWWAAGGFFVVKLWWIAWWMWSAGWVFLSD
jgi:hypothetical protein